MALIDLTATELLGRLQAGEVTSVELTRAFLDRIGQCDSKVKAFLRVDPPAALARAEEIDQPPQSRQAASDACKACPWPSRICSAQKASPRPAHRGFWKISGPLTMPR